MNDHNIIRFCNSFKTGNSIHYRALVFKATFHDFNDIGDAILLCNAF